MKDILNIFSLIVFMCMLGMGIYLDAKGDHKKATRFFQYATILLIFGLD